MGCVVSGGGEIGCGAVMLVKLTVEPDAGGDWAAEGGVGAGVCFDASIISEERRVISAWCLRSLSCSSRRLSTLELAACARERESTMASDESA